jgi:large subunit ribosomal protein L23
MRASYYDIIQFPHITEKTTIMSDKGKYVFKVRMDACKKNIKAAIENIFNVKITKVNIIVSKGKKKVFKGTIGQRQDFKKVIVTLEPGQILDLAKGV